MLYLKTTLASIPIGVVHKRRRQLDGGKGSKIGQNCRSFLIKKCRRPRGGRGKKYVKLANVLNGWFLYRYIFEFVSVTTVLGLLEHSEDISICFVKIIIFFENEMKPHLSQDMNKSLNTV